MLTLKKKNLKLLPPHGKKKLVLPLFTAITSLVFLMLNIVREKFITLLKRGKLIIFSFFFKLITTTFLKNLNPLMMDCCDNFIVVILFVRVKFCGTEFCLNKPLVQT